MSMLTAIEIADLRGDHGYLTPGPRICVTCEEEFPCMYARLMDDHDRLVTALTSCIGSDPNGWTEEERSLMEEMEEIE